MELNLERILIKIIAMTTNVKFCLSHDDR